MSLREDVLNSLAVEAELTPETLQQYLDRWPDLADDLRELYEALIRVDPDDDREMTPEEEAEGEAYAHTAWLCHVAAGPGGTAEDTITAACAVLREALAAPSPALTRMRIEKAMKVLERKWGRPEALAASA